MIRISILTCVMLAFPLISLAKVVGRSVEYKIGDKTFEGYLAYDDAKEGKRPGVLVVHEWWGLNDYTKKRADMLAELGYVAFAGDMYGKGIVADNATRAGELAGALKNNPSQLRERANKALDVLAHDEHVDPKRLAAIGYCFGGTTVLELAYSGAPLAGIVTFHGGLVNPSESDRDQIKARLLVLTGGDDPMVPSKAIDEFQNALKGGKIDYQVVIYSGAKHGFTNPEADKRGIQGLGYSPSADRRSWEHMRLFFNELFK